MAEFSEGGQPEASSSGALRDKLIRYNLSPTHELAWIYKGDLREISSLALRGSEDDKASVRPLFKRILFGTPSWMEGATFVRQCPELIYAPQERTIVEQEKARAAERAQTIEEEVAQGVSPWLARVRHNEQTMQNPYIVGYYQDEDGKIKTLYGERTFRSQRQIENSFLAWRSETKEVNLLDTQLQPVKDHSLMKSEYWELLPEDLRRRFEGGEILVTSGADMYDFPEEQLDVLSRSPSPDALLRHVREQTHHASDGYRVLYYSDYRSDDTGRTGVLLTTVNGEVKPVTVTIDGKEYVVELKGVGKKSGGFGTMQFRTGRDIITGGAEKEQALDEFKRLQERGSLDGPKVAGSITFDNNGYEQGYIIRLTPSTVRASYSGNEVYPEIDSPENVKRVLDMYASELVDHIFANPPKILDRSSHTENILLWGDGQSTFTDFSDHVGFSDTNFPHREDKGGYMTPKQMLRYYIKMVKEIPGYDASRDNTSFQRVVAQAFLEKGRQLTFHKNDDPDDMTQKLWAEGGVAYQVYKARKGSGYVAEGAIKDFDEMMNGRYTSKDLSLHSEAEFVQKLQTMTDNMREALIALRGKMTTDADRTLVDQLSSSLEQGRLLIDEDIVNAVFNKMQSTIDFDNQDDLRINRAFHVLGSYSYALTPMNDYLSYEADVTRGAKMGVPESEREEVEQADREAQEKLSEFNAIVGDPHRLFVLLTNMNEARKLMTFNYLQK